MHVIALPIVVVTALGLLVASPLQAEPVLAHLSRVEGTVTLLHRFAPAPASVGVSLYEGDQIVTAIGRAEVSFADGSVMHLDQHTHVVMAGTARIRLLDGRVSLRTTTAYTAETTGGGVHVLSGHGGAAEGVFELTASAANHDVLVRVVEGRAEIASPWGRESVTSTQTAFVSGPTGRPFVSPWIALQHDSFLQWGNARFVAARPPTFLPYAHPTYRQFAYERSLRKTRYERKDGDAPTRTGPHVRGERRRDASTTAREPSGERRRDPARTDRQERPRQARPAPAPRVSRPVRGAAKGAVVRQP